MRLFSGRPDVVWPIGDYPQFRSFREFEQRLFGAYFPFAKTAVERSGSGDPRPSLQERYTDQAGYVAALTAAANDLVARRFMLRADADAAIANAAANPVLP